MRMEFSLGAELEGLSKSGWFTRSLLGEEASAHKKLCMLKESLNLEFIDIIGSGDYVLSDLVRLEFLKSSIRSIIRYSLEAGEFAKVVSSRLIEADMRWSSYFLTPPYLIFHLPQDESEAGSIHSDMVQDSGNMFTWWTPINNRQLKYPALVIFQRSHTVLRYFLYRLYLKIGKCCISLEKFLYLLRSAKYNLVPDKGSSYFWFSRLLHMGNLNVEDESHCAVVFRVSQRPLYYEPSNTLTQVANHLFDQDSNPDIREIYRKLIIAEHLAKKAPDLLKSSIETEKWISSIFEEKELFDPKHSRHLSFALTLIAQRFSSNPLSIPFYLLSFLVGKENLVGLERLLKGIEKHSDVEWMLKILRRYESLDSFQEKTLLRKLGILCILDNKESGTQPIIRSWITAN